MQNAEPVRVAVVVKKIRKGSYMAGDGPIYTELYPEVLADDINTGFEGSAYPEPSSCFLLTQDSPIPDVGALAIMEKTNELTVLWGRKDNTTRLWRVWGDDNEETEEAA